MGDIGSAAEPPFLFWGGRDGKAEPFPLGDGGGAGIGWNRVAATSHALEGVVTLGLNSKGRFNVLLSSALAFVQRSQ